MTLQELKKWADSKEKVLLILKLYLCGAHGWDVFVGLWIWERAEKYGIVHQEPTILWGRNFYPCRPIPEEGKS